MKRMVKDHREDLKHFEHEAKARNPNDATEFASRQMPILVEHLRMAQATYDIAAGPKRTASRETGSARQ
jgi:hypothetical protein